jgi:isopenicillin N synthase-like dioxygenase
VLEQGRAFFAQELERKLELRMERGGRAWRGYFPLGAELTSGHADHKEGLYLGSELGPDHPAVVAGLPLHGPNLFPELAGFRDAVLAYLAALTRVGHALTRGLALGLGLEADYFAQRYTADPLVLLRLFHYPPLERGGGKGRVDAPIWSVGEHSDYGFLTILLQDEHEGLEVQSQGRWMSAPPVAGSFVCNLGDILERMTRGRYLSTPHRVRNLGPASRLSVPFYFDPNFEAVVAPVEEGEAPLSPARKRWDDASVHALTGTYGEYLVAKVSKVFPHLVESLS